jgi:hypothetical protein
MEKDFLSGVLGRTGDASATRLQKKRKNSL